MDPKEHDWMTVKQTATMLQIPLTRCYELINIGELPAVRIGQRSIRVSQREVEEFLTENRRIHSGNS